MEKLIWSKQFETKVPEMDQQHQSLFRIINQLIELCNTGVSDSDQFFTILKQLTEYSQYHFRLENNFIHQGTYIGKTRHLDAHDLYLARLNAFIDDFAVEKENLRSEMLEFLIMWWTKHIIETDKGLSAHVIQNDLTFSGME